PRSRSDRPATSRSCPARQLRRQPAASSATRAPPASPADATPGVRWRKKTSARLERVLQLFHQQVVHPAGDLLEQLVAVGQLVLAARLVAAAARALRGVDAGRGGGALGSQ